jgi:phenylacetate-coenzyme A ligase PaaK-like adenylate-forming protein
MIISSGGTTSEPKYRYISNEQMKCALEQCHYGLVIAGLTKDDILVNYFPPGNLWCVYDLISNIRGDYTLLNIGRQSDTALLCSIYDKFKPNSIIGIPSHLIELCKNHPELKFEKVFFTSEPLLSHHRALLKKNWETKLIRSIGYGSADAGILSYQCQDCENDEYHPYDGIHIDVDANENIVVVNPDYLNHNNPVLTGDKGQIVEGHNNLRTFKLLGRNDGVLLIWGARLSLKEVKSACENSIEGYINSQVIVFSEDCEDFLKIVVDATSDVMLRENCIRNEIWQSCSDLRAVMDWDKFVSRVLIHQEDSTNFIRSENVRKIKPFVDLR